MSRRNTWTPDCATPRRLNNVCKPNHGVEQSTVSSTTCDHTLSSTARRYTHSRGETVTVSFRFRSNGTHGDSVGHTATIRSWETTWTALRRQHLLRCFSNLMRWNIDDLFGNTSRTVLGKNVECISRAHSDQVVCDFMTTNTTALKWRFSMSTTDPPAFTSRSLPRKFSQGVQFP